MIPILELTRVDTDANEGFHVMSATNREQAVSENDENKFPPTYPALQGHDDVIHAPEFASEPEFAGHAVHVPELVASL
jgi:hypothetical protein